MEDTRTYRRSVMRGSGWRRRRVGRPGPSRWRACAVGAERDLVGVPRRVVHPRPTGREAGTQRPQARRRRSLSTVAIRRPSAVKLGVNSSPGALRDGRSCPSADRRTSASRRRRSRAGAPVLGSNPMPATSPSGDHADRQARQQRPGVDERRGAVEVSDGEGPAVRAQRRHHLRARRQRPRRPDEVRLAIAGVATGRERAAEPAVAGEVPDEDLAVERAGVERSAVAADRQPVSCPL